MTEASLAELIQSQEKLCDGYGAKRKTVSVGIYRAQKITFPVHYRMVEAKSAKFVPLGMDDELDLAQILEQHPKGKEYAHILQGKPLVPLLQDDAGQILSFPPIINSRAIGEVVAGDTELFVEATGTDLRSVLLVENILAVDLEDRGWTIEPVIVEYPFDTPFGREVRAPYPLTNEVEVPDADFNRLLGGALSADQIAKELKAYGCDVAKGSAAGRTRVSTQPYRQDYMHPVDAIEDLAVVVGVNTLEPVWPERFTPGRLAKTTLVEDKARAKVDDLVRDAAGRGARVLAGGHALDGPGYFYAPTVLLGVPVDAGVFREEIFGPVAPVFTFGDEDEAVRLANDTEYGLASYVFTGDVKRLHRIGDRLEFGLVGLNAGVISNAAAPFGGVKQSGLGREGGAEGLAEYTSVQYQAMPSPWS